MQKRKENMKVCCQKEVEVEVMFEGRECLDRVDGKDVMFEGCGCNECG